MGGVATRPGLGSQIWYFARHFLEMCAAMCIGGVILNGLLFVAGPALLGYGDLREEAPELALLVLAFNYALPMAAWMRFRGMAWRPTLEMSGATVGLAVVMIGLDWLDVVQQSTVRGWVLGFCGPACVVMVIVMLFRLDLYTGRTGHQMGGPTRHVERVPEIHRGEPDRVLGGHGWGHRGSRGGTRTHAAGLSSRAPHDCSGSRWGDGGAGTPVTVVALPGRRAGLEDVEKVLAGRRGGSRCLGSLGS